MASEAWLQRQRGGFERERGQSWKPGVGVGRAGASVGASTEVRCDAQFFLFFLCFSLFAFIAVIVLVEGWRPLVAERGYKAALLSAKCPPWPEPS